MSWRGQVALNAEAVNTILRGLLIFRPAVAVEIKTGARRMQLAFLAPDVVEAIIDNRKTLCDGVIKLTTSRLPLSWHRQIALLNPDEKVDASHER